MKVTVGGELTESRRDEMRKPRAAALGYNTKTMKSRKDDTALHKVQS